MGLDLDQERVGEADNCIQIVFSDLHFYKLSFLDYLEAGK